MDQTRKGKPKARGHGEGSLFRRADGRWAGVVSVGWRNGKRLRKTVYGKTRTAVQRKVTKLLSDQQLGLPIIVERQSVAQFMRTWLDHTVAGRVRPKTLRSYRQLTEHHITPSIGRLELQKLTPQHVEAMLNDIVQVKKLSPRTAQYVRTVLRRALKHAMRLELVQRNVAALVDPPRVVTRQIQPFTVQQIPKLLEAFGGHRLGALFLLAMSHGLRQGEALGLTWGDVDLKGKTVRVRQALQWLDGKPVFVEPKTDKSRRTIPVSDEVIRVLKQYRRRQLEDRLRAGSKWQDTGLVFTTRTGGPLDGVNVTRDFKRMLKNAGLPQKSFHSLRHSAATFMLYRKVDMKVASATLGHADIRTTMNIYAHVAPELEREAAQQIDALLKAAKARRK